MIKKIKLLIITLIALIPGNHAHCEKFPVADSINIEISDVVVKNTETEIDLSLFNQNKKIRHTGKLPVNINGKREVVGFIQGKAKIYREFDNKQKIIFEYKEIQEEKIIKPVPLWMSILPPLIAILFALIFKEVFSALIIGIFSGTLIISFFSNDGVFDVVLNAFLRLIDTYIINALNDPGHLSIIVFSLMIGGMVGIITKNGGMRGVVSILSRKAKTSRSGQLTTWIMGFAIFFDDYANTLVVGNTMKNLTDKLKISREKLAYIVDSTAAPIASIAFITTWIGAELSYIQDGINTIGLDTNPYNIFFASLKYSFYPITALLFVLIIIFTRRDYGPMYKKEIAARKSKAKIYEDTTSEKSTKKSSPYNALIPVLIIIFGTIAGLIYSGWDTTLWNNENISTGSKLSQIIGRADSFKALLWSSFASILVAVTITVSKKILTLRKSIDSMVGGFKSMLNAILILTLAWALALITENLHTAEFISETMRNLSVNARLVPALSFVFSALIAFSTGSSWGTMAIMYPLILPSSWIIFMDSGLDQETSIMLFNNIVSTVIAGSVMGDHCSPISDTTILSSLASGCPHIQHVRTQMPYALTAGIISILAGTLPASFGFPVILSFLISLIVLILVIFIFGKKLPVTKL